MLIDELNRKGDQESLFPVSVEAPLISYHFEGLLYIGCAIDYGDGVWMVDPHLYNDETDSLTAVKISFKFSPGDIIRKVHDSDGLRLSACLAQFNVGIISGVPFACSTRIH